MSRIIQIEDIEEGMISIEPIVNRFGQTLLAAGVSLTPQHSVILKTWNIRTIKVKGEDENEGFTISPELKDLLISKIRKRANWKPKQNIENDMLSMALLHYSKQYIKRGDDERVE